MLRNQFRILESQEAIMNALDEVLLDKPRYESDEKDEQRRKNIRMDLGSLAGHIHYYLEDWLKRNELRECEGQTKN